MSINAFADIKGTRFGVRRMDMWTTDAGERGAWVCPTPITMWRTPKQMRAQIDGGTMAWTQVWGTADRWTLCAINLPGLGESIHCIMTVDLYNRLQSGEVPRNISIYVVISRNGLVKDYTRADGWVNLVNQSTAAQPRVIHTGVGAA